MTAYRMILLATVLAGAGVLLLPTGVLSFLLSDDAYYYLKTAQNTIALGFPTFDGINETDGFHPLWMAVLIVASSISAAGPEAFLKTALLLQLGLGASLICLVLRLAKPFGGGASETFVAVFLAVTFTLASPGLIWFNGLESALAITLIALILGMNQETEIIRPNLSWQHAAVFGGLAGLMMLARLDSAFLLVGLALWCLVTRRSGLGAFPQRVATVVRTYWPAVLVFVLVIGPYFIWKQLQFGHLTPISGALKTTFPDPVFRPKVLLQNAPYVLSLFVAGVYLVGLFRQRAVGSRHADIQLLAGFWIGCVIHLVWTVCFMGWGTFQWHFAVYVPVVAMILALSAAGSLWPFNVLKGRAIVVLSVVVVGSYAVVIGALRGDHHLPRIKAADWAYEALGADAVIGLRDAGAFGYYSNTSTVNIDGLINGYEFQTAMADGKVGDYFDAIGMQYLADAYVPCDYSAYTVGISAYPGKREYFHSVHVATMTISREVFRSTPADNQRQFGRSADPVCFVIWEEDGSSFVRRQPVADIEPGQNQK